jgi:hypothetical protein
MAIPFASGYAPINLLNNAIQAQDARRDQGYLDASKINEASISDALNRVVQQRALQQQAALQQQHYGLQQQQLANDLAARNQQFGLLTQQQAEAKRQFDQKLAQDKLLVEAQAKALGRESPYALQSDADAEMYNRDAMNGESEANQIKAALDRSHQIASDKIKRDHYWTEKGRQDDLNALDSAFAVNVAKINGQVKHGDKIRFNPITGKFEAIQMRTRAGGGAATPGAPTGIGDRQPNFGEPGFDTSGSDLASTGTTAAVNLAPASVVAKQASPFGPGFGQTAPRTLSDTLAPWRKFGLFVGQPDVAPVMNAPVMNMPAPTVESPAQSSPFSGIGWSRFPAGYVQPQTGTPTWSGNAPAAPTGGIGINWTRGPSAPPPALAAPIPVSQGAGLLPIGLPVLKSQAIKGIHFRINPDGTATTLAPIIDNGQLIPAGTTARPTQ